MRSAASRLSLAITILALSVAADVQADASGTAELIATSSGCPGGICVILGNPDADLAVAMSQQGQYVVQALYSAKETLDRSRAAIRAAGTYGIVSADLRESGRLPYAENLINVVVVDNYPDLRAKAASLSEIVRVLAPLGVVYLGDADSSAGRNAPWVKSLSAELRNSGFEAPDVLTGAGTWVKAAKPWPGDIDEWTHYLHGADGNAVAQDRVVAPPKHYQWISDPLWLRSHETDSSVRTIVTARGRLFYIVDDAPISLPGDHDLPDKWTLTAQDAFNGVLLWKVPIEDWGWRVWKTSWFTPRPGGIPLNIEKRLVAVGDRVYVTLGYRAPVSELDARTGEVLRTFEQTARTAEILHHDGTLILTVLGDDRARVAAVDAQSGRRLWTSANDYAGTTTDYYRFTSMRGSVEPADVDPTLNTATDGTVVALLDGADVVCLDYGSGNEKWRTAFPLVDADKNAGNIAAEGRVWMGALIVQDGMVIHASPNQLAGFSAASGEMLWTQPKKYLGHLWYEWKEVFVIDGLVWTWSAELGKGKLDGAPDPTKGNSTWPATVNGYDLHTGKLTKSVPLGNIFKTHHHHRCYRNKATSRYILASRRGTEYVDLEEGKHSIHNWVRGTCHVGMMPANGLQYAPPHPCVCYIEEKLNGMNALAPAIRSDRPSAERAGAEALERGPAYGRASGDTADAADWPAFRHDSMRSGCASTTVPGEPRLLWRERIGINVGPPIAVGSTLFAPLVDEHHVVALRASDGKRLWEYAAGGRIDSPPTYYRGTLIFGSTDGCVYCVRADDGQLVWRFRAAPEDRRIGAYGQLESAWPVHGSVLVLDGTAYFSAGRSSHLDGGIHLFGIDAVTGELRCQTRLEGPSYDVDNIDQNYRLPMGSLADILHGGGQTIFMRTRTFNTELEQARPAPSQAVNRISARGGFLDDSYFKRAPWSVGRSGYARLVVHDRQAVYSVRMFDSLQGLDPTVYFTPGKAGYLLFATDKQAGKQTWSRRIPVRINAMVSTDGLLFAAGAPDVVDADDPLGAFEGRKGGTLSAVDSATGETRWEYTLEAPPVFNGMAAAGGRLYLAMQDGTIACFGG